MYRPILPDCKPRTIRIMERKEDDKLVLYRGHRLFVMGPHAAEIWQMCNGEHTIDEMIRLVAGRYDVSKEKASDEIISFINRLVDMNLVVL